MTITDRITQLEARLAQAERRIAELEGRTAAPVFAPQPWAPMRETTAPWWTRVSYSESADSVKVRFDYSLPADA